MTHAFLNVEPSPTSCHCGSTITTLETLIKNGRVLQEQSDPGRWLSVMSVSNNLAKPS